jgi:hypothetical protein
MIPLHGQNKMTLNMGGGVSTPLNPTGAYTGVSGNFNFGAGYNLNAKNSISGEFLWSGLPADVFPIHPIDSPTGKINLYSLTVNYRHHIDSIHGSIFGLYAIAGGGWYYRYASIDKNFTVPPGTPCQPYYYWWGYGCSEGYVYSQTVAYKGASAGGLLLRRDQRSLVHGAVQGNGQHGIQHETAESEGQGRLVQSIKSHLAFYPNRVDSIEERPAS